MTRIEDTDWLWVLKRAIVLVRPHQWHNSWPGNFCEACGLDDPWETAICCPACHWVGGNDIDPPRVEDLVLELCFFHKYLLSLPCEGYVPNIRTSLRDPVARERCSYPGRWFLVAADGLHSPGLRWWQSNFYSHRESEWLSYELPKGAEVIEFRIRRRPDL